MVVAFSLILALLVLVLLLSSLRVVGDHERLAIVRLGRYLGLKGPGLVLVVPGIDRGIRLDLDRDIPDWRALSAEGVEERILQLMRMRGM